MPSRNSTKVPKSVPDGGSRGSFKVLQPFTTYTSPSKGATFSASLANGASTVLGPIEADILRIVTTVPSSASDLMKIRYQVGPGMGAQAGDGDWLPLAANTFVEYLSLKDQGGHNGLGGKPDYIAVRNDSGNTAKIYITEMI